MFALLAASWLNALEDNMNINTPVRQAVDKFLQQPGRTIATRQKYRYKLKHFLENYGDIPISDVTPELLERWFAQLERQYSDGHLAMHRSCHKTFWRFCAQFTGSNPADAIPRYSEVPEQVVTARKDEVDAALRACESMVMTITEQRDAAIFVLGSCGLRRSNVRSVRTSAVIAALQNPVVVRGENLYAMRTKGKEGMEVIFNERHARIIKRYVKNRPSTDHDRLFVNLNTYDKNYLRPLSDEGFGRARRRVCKRAGVQLISFQKMRRLVGTSIARKYGLETAAQVLGHRSGTEVIRKHYYDPDKEAARLAAFDVISHL